MNPLYGSPAMTRLAAEAKCQLPLDGTALKNSGLLRAIAIKKDHEKTLKLPLHVVWFGPVNAQAPAAQRLARWRKTGVALGRMYLPSKPR